MQLAIVIALGIAWTALWFYAASEAEKRLNDWQEQQAKGGRVFTCASRSAGAGHLDAERIAADRPVRAGEGAPALRLLLLPVVQPLLGLARRVEP